jgi:hypothetical protein
MTSTSLPTPKFAIGDVVYWPTTETTKEPMPCPDCLGTRRWKVITPAGTEMEAECQRCTGFGRIADLPKPERLVSKPSVRRLTIGKITASTHASYGDRDRVEYMCSETGIGSGSIYQESQLFSTEDEAMAVAIAEADKRTAEYAEAPRAMEERKLERLTIKDADLEATRSARWNAWYSYTSLRDTLKEVCENESGDSASDRLDTLNSELEYDRNYRDLPDIGAALKSLRSMVPDTAEAHALFETLAAPAQRTSIQEAAE